MNILLTAATLLEIRPSVDFLDNHWNRQQENVYGKGDRQVHILISGIGTLFTSYTLTRYLSGHSCDLAVQAGIAGSFKRANALGELLLVENEILGDLGMENGENFEDLFDSGFLTPDIFPFRQKMLPNDLQEVPAPFQKLRKANSISVNRVSGHAATVKLLENKYHPDIETMEGAAFHYICLRENIPFFQLRSISNYVETRDKRKWDIPLAVKNLNDCLVDWLKEQWAGE